MAELFKIAQQHRGHPLYEEMVTYLQGRIERYRERNDTAPLEEVPRNQGAIQALNQLLKQLTYQSNTKYQH